MTMRILVTGATGFIGRALVAHLCKCGHEPIAVVRNSQSVDGAETVRWDLGAERAPAGLPLEIDAIVHAAQSRNYRAFPADAGEMFAVNTASTFALLEYAARAGVGQVCLLSSGTVYAPFADTLGETARLAPPTMLGASKLAAEALAAPFRALFPISILRVFTPYGPGQTARLVPDIVDRVQTGKSIELTADGAGLRLAPIYVDDLCKIVLACLAEQWAETLNVAAPQALYLRDLAEQIGSIVGREPHFVVNGGAALDLAPPVQRLAARFNLGALVPIEEGLRRIIRLG
ncbi:NAD-dependent epimerase/dehydratase family protein [Methylobacterium sp. A49B]